MKVSQIQPVRRVPSDKPERDEKKRADNLASGQSFSNLFEQHLDIARREQNESEKSSTQRK